LSGLFFVVAYPCLSMLCLRRVARRNAAAVPRTSAQFPAVAIRCMVAPCLCFAGDSFALAVLCSADLRHCRSFHRLSTPLQCKDQLTQSLPHSALAPHFIAYHGYAFALLQVAIRCHAAPCLCEPWPLTYSPCRCHSFLFLAIAMLFNSLLRGSYPLRSVPVPCLGRAVLFLSWPCLCCATRGLELPCHSLASPCNSGQCRGGSMRFYPMPLLSSALPFRAYPSRSHSQACHAVASHSWSRTRLSLLCHYCAIHRLSVAAPC